MLVFYSRLSVSDFPQSGPSRIILCIFKISFLVHVHQKLFAVILHTQPLFSVLFEVLTTESCDKWLKVLLSKRLLKKHCSLFESIRLVPSLLIILISLVYHSRVTWSLLTLDMFLSNHFQLDNKYTRVVGEKKKVIQEIVNCPKKKSSLCDGYKSK